MSLKTEQKLLDFGKWWNYHTHGTDDGGKTVQKLPEDIDKRTELLCKAIDSLAHIYINITEDIRVLEGRGPIGSSVRRIVTPGNILGRNNG